MASPDRSSMWTSGVLSFATGEESKGAIRTDGALLKIKPTEGLEESNKEKGDNLVVNDVYRDTAIEIFENYFARAYKRKENAPMTEKRFVRAIERARKRENFEDAYVEQFK